MATFGILWGHGPPPPKSAYGSGSVASYFRYGEIVNNYCSTKYSEQCDSEIIIKSVNI